MTPTERLALLEGAAILALDSLMSIPPGMEDQFINFAAGQLATALMGSTNTGTPEAVAECRARLVGRGVRLVDVTPTLPPIGSRFGDLSPEQRTALPVGTIVAWEHLDETEMCRKTDDKERPWLCVQGHDRGRRYERIADDNTIDSYPTEATP